MSAAKEVAVEKLVRAWVDPGPVPEVHYNAIMKLEREWPTLYSAIRTLVNVQITEGSNVGE